MKSTRDNLFEAAVHLFAENGYKGTSIRTLAKACDIKESSVYNHFKNKEAILDAILDYQVESFKTSHPPFEAIDAIAQKHTCASDFWLETADAFIGLIPPLMDTINVILSNEMYLNEKCRSHVTETMFTQEKQLTIMSLQYMYSKGWLKDIDFESVANQYVYLLYGLETEHRIMRLNGTEEDLSNRWKKIVGDFIRGLEK